MINPLIDSEPFMLFSFFRKMLMNSTSFQFVRSFVCALLLLLYCLPAIKTKAANAPRPNVLLILTDDQGYGDIGSHGNPHLKTPVLDELAESGSRFDRFYVSPVCAPTRASLLTGRYHLRTGVTGVTRGYENMNPVEITLAECFQQGGYRTGCFGKWHNGRHMPMHPNGQGFEEFFGFCGGHWNTYFDAPLEHNGTPVSTKGYIIDVLTDHAIDFMEENQRQPWFCYVPFNTPHSPWRVPDENWNHYNGLGLDSKAQCAYAMVENIDDNVGRLLESLEQTGQSQRTIVLFLTDNGANSDRYNAGMLGRKGSHNEGGVRVPCFIRYPGRVPANTTIQEISAHIDLLPTLLEFCFVERPAGPPLDGVSLVPLLTQRNSDWPERMIFTDTFRSKSGLDKMNGAVRTQQWRATTSRGQWQLFDMQNDPGQKKNVAAEHPELVANYAQAYEEWFASTGATEIGERPIPIGHSSRQQFELYPCESELIPGHGEGISYTGDTPNGFANCWIHEWTDPAAYPEWKLDVLEAGEYEIELEYTCHRNDVGVEMEVSIGDQTNSVVIPKAYDPPLDEKPDHVFSYNYQTKAGWAKITTGRMKLPAGSQTAQVKIKHFARKGIERPAQGIDLRVVRLKRVEKS